MKYMHVQKWYGKMSVATSPKDDVIAAINIGCRFLAGAMGKGLGPWTRRKKDEGTTKTTTNSNTGTRVTVTPRLVGWARVFESSKPEIPVSRLFQVYRCPKKNKQQTTTTTNNNNKQP